MTIANGGLIKPRRRHDWALDAAARIGVIACRSAVGKMALQHLGGGG